MGWRDWIPKPEAPSPGVRSVPRDRRGARPFDWREHGARHRLPPSEPSLEPVPPPSERAAIASEDGGVPRCYASAWATLQAGPPPGIPRDLWAQAVADAGAFLDEWGEPAERFGWRVADLFDPPDGSGAPGLLWALAGGRVLIMTDREAVFQRAGRRVWFCIPSNTGRDRETRNG